MSLITVFEERNFQQWLKTGLDESKTDILDYAHELYFSTLVNQSDITLCTVFKDIILSLLDEISFCVNNIDMNYGVVDSALGDTEITLQYKDTLVHKALGNFDKSGKVTHRQFSVYIKKLSYFITDAVVVIWKRNHNIKYHSVIVYNSKTSLSAEFPVSYNTYKLVLEVEKITGKKVEFHNLLLTYPVIKINSILCFFNISRLETEISLQIQLIEVMMKKQGFKTVNKYYFNSPANAVFSRKNYEIALHILLQTVYINELISYKYQIFKSELIYDMLDMQVKENYMNNVYAFICQFLKNNGVCKNCFLDDDLKGSYSSCVLFSEEGFIMKELISSGADEGKGINTADKQQCVVECIMKETYKRIGGL